MQRGLFTWRLIPTDKDSDLLALSTYSGEVWVRARDAVEARDSGRTQVPRARLYKRRQKRHGESVVCT